MLKTRKTKMERGITLIALIITIVVLLILAAVAISSIINDGVLSYAENGTTKYNQAVKNEQDTLQGYVDYLNKHNGGTGSENGESSGNEGEGEGTGSEGSGDNTGNVSGEIISKEIDYTGCYADVDGDGNIDGIIYADLAVGKSGQWTDEDGAYSYEAKTNLNNYTERDATAEEQDFFKTDKTKVIVPTGNRVEANDRFYVMALSDVHPETFFCWYSAADGNMNDYETATSGDFGTGKENTATMIGKWNSEAYGSKNTGRYADMWGVIQEEVSNGWFVPSRAEWSAFGDAFSINKGNYTEFGLGATYWPSSQITSGSAWFVGFYYGYMFGSGVFSGSYVRLGTTF